MPKVIPLPVRQQLVCSECGADGEGSCRCGAPYVPAGQRAADAIAANPTKSNCAIAEEVGVNPETVRRARKNSTAADAAVEEKRTGKDGKSRRMPQSRSPSPEEWNVALEKSWQQELMDSAGDTIALPAFWAKTFGKWDTFTATSVMITLAEQAAAAWQQIANDLKRRKAE